MRCAKYHGCGNDFILLNVAPSNPYQFAIDVCNRHSGIGADGIMWIETSSQADLKMKYLNSDGSPAKMCGNGLRCFVQFALDEKRIDQKQFVVETDAGNIEVSVIEDYKKIELKLMLPRDLDKTENISNQPLVNIDGLMLNTLHLGTLHAVIFDESNLDRQQLGPQLTKDTHFPQEINVNFARIINRNLMEVQTHERGAGWTLACGTGIAASAYTAIQKGLVNTSVEVHAKGGICWVHVDSNHVHLIGPAVKIADIEIGG